MHGLVRGFGLVLNVTSTKLWKTFLLEAIVGLYARIKLAQAV